MNSFLLISLFLCLSLACSAKNLLVPKQFNQSGNAIEFVENKGQFKYSDGNSAEDVLFVANTDYGRLLVRKSGITFVVMERISEQSTSKHQDKMLDIARQPELQKFKTSSTEMIFAGANPEPKISAFEPLESYNNYYIADKAVTFVKIYKKIVIEKIYPSIDFVLYSDTARTLEYDFVVHAGGNPSQIALKFNNYNDIHQNAQQNLIIKNELATIEHVQPFSYQNSKNKPNAIQSSFTLDKNNCLRFNVGDYNPKEKLVIDPLIRVYGYGYGGRRFDEPYDIAVDSLGNTYTGGFTYSSDLFVTTNQYTMLGGCDGFIIKLDSLGNRVWSTYYGGSDGDWVNGIAVDKTGMIVVLGSASKNSKDLFTNVNQLKMNGYGDAFIAKFDPKGKLIWSTFFGWDSQDGGNKITIDDKNDIFVCGTIKDTIGSYKPLDIFVLKLSSGGLTEWATKYGGNGNDYANDLAIDKNGDVYISGTTYSNDLPELKETIGYKDNGDVYIAKFDKVGKLIWTRYYGTDMYEGSRSIAVDDSGFVFITGSSESSNLRTNRSDTHFHGEEGRGDIIVAKFSPDGDLIWGEYFGSPNSETGMHIALDKFNNIYVTGDATNYYPDSIGMIGNVYQKRVKRGDDAFVLMLNADGDYVWCTLLGGYYDDYGISICVDQKQNIFVTGKTLSRDMDITGVLSPKPKSSIWKIHLFSNWLIL